MYDPNDDETQGDTPKGDGEPVAEAKASKGKGKGKGGKMGGGKGC